jgi:ABC-2 type transport system ATP-binding protein
MRPVDDLATAAAVEASTRPTAAADLEIDRVSVVFGSRQVLDEISFTVPPGRVVGLLGPNGAGKTTVMRSLFGIVPPDSGQVRWRGRPVRREDRLRWGYMPQERGLYVKMPVLDHITYLGRLRGLTKGQATERARELLDSLGLADRGGDKVEGLSGGMQQRVQLACALVHHPEVLVLDEPFSGLDPVAVDQLSAVIAEQATAGRTVLFSSHQLDLVEDICETIVLVDQGRVVLDGDLHRLKAASRRRMLRLGLSDAAAGWEGELVGASVVQRNANETVLQLEPAADPLAVLDQARRAGSVHDFALELPRLSQLFLEAVRR